MKEEQYHLSIKEQINTIEPLCSQLKAANDCAGKLQIVASSPLTIEFFQKVPLLRNLIAECSPADQFVIQAVLAIGQGPVAFRDIEILEHPLKELHKFIQILLELEKFYDVQGGIVGYHLLVLKLMDAKQKLQEDELSKSVNFEEPEGVDLSRDTLEVRKAIRWGIDYMPVMAEIYPIGGAGDRLSLLDPATNELLPAAQLPFCGRSLLEGLIRDLQGREFLYYKLKGKQITMPVAAMTSHEKNNHQLIISLCKTNDWFGRLRESFVFFIQHLVPMVTIEGNWVMQSPLHPILKPGGHGVLWKVAKDLGVFNWLEQFGCRKALVRQINNPMAGIDHGLLALSGIGCFKDKDFGFASCPRLPSVAEGVNVLCERHVNDLYEYNITNIEYTEFERFGISDIPEKSGNSFSRFPSNTNVLFVDLDAIKSAVSICPIPGMLINMKTSVMSYEGCGKSVKKLAGRLESTMQNIADYIVDRFPIQLLKGNRGDLRTFLTYNERCKTISVAKQAYVSGESFVGTPEGCFFELMENYRDLLGNYCYMKLPSSTNKMNYLVEGPSFVANFHPALGLLYSVIGQKIRGGSLAKGSEWIMEIAEAEIDRLDLNGSLIIEADAIMGQKDVQGQVIYDSSKCGKCTLRNVKVKNLGVEGWSGLSAWKHEYLRKEALRITLHGNAEFFAEGVVFEGPMHFEVPIGHKLVIAQSGSKITERYEKIKEASWQWHYSFDDEDRIQVKRI